MEEVIEINYHVPKRNFHLGDMVSFRESGYIGHQNMEVVGFYDQRIACRFVANLDGADANGYIVRLFDKSGLWKI